MAAPESGLILVTGAAPGQVGSVAYKVVQLLRARGKAVRALVHRLDDRVQLLEKEGAQVVVGDLCDVKDVSRAMEGVRCPDGNGKRGMCITRAAGRSRASSFRSPWDRPTLKPRL